MRMRKRRLLKDPEAGRGVTFEEAKTFAALIEEVFNKKRLHSNLGYIPPVGFEAGYAPKRGFSPNILARRVFRFPTPRTANADLLLNAEIRLPCCYIS